MDSRVFLREETVCIVEVWSFPGVSPWPAALHAMVLWRLRHYSFPARHLPVNVVCSIMQQYASPYMTLIYDTSKRNIGHYERTRWNVSAFIRQRRQRSRTMIRLLQAVNILSCRHSWWMKYLRTRQFSCSVHCLSMFALPAGLRDVLLDCSSDIYLSLVPAHHRIIITIIIMSLAGSAVSTCWARLFFD